MLSVKDARNKLEQLKGQKTQIEHSIDMNNREIKLKKRELRQHEQAREILKEVAVRTQEQLAFHIEDITSLALNSVFPHPYEMKVEFLQRRNKTECDLYFVRDGVKMSPLSSAGGGAVDVASFALRVASWSMQTPHSRNTLLLDEPFKHLSTSLLPAAREMVQQISEKLNLQIIFITHSEELEESDGKKYRAALRKGNSVVTAI